MAATWKSLQFEGGDDSPPLFISATFSENSYTVYLTDLVYIWSESLDRRAIVKRSVGEDSPIDLEDGDLDQLRVLLEKIKNGLDGARNTTLTLSPSAAKGDGPKRLEMFLEVPLPKPLQALKWPLYLESLPQSSFAAQLTIPLLRAQNSRLKELDGLVEKLKEKDRVIQKLVDKLEATGAELGHVFPAAAGKGGRKISRSLAEERVKGLGPFDVEEWKTEVRGNIIGHATDTEEEMGDVISHVFSSEVGRDLVGLKDAGVARNLEKWWDNLGKFSKPKKATPAKPEPSKGKGSITKNDKSFAAEDSDDDFQVQATPPHLMSPSKKQPAQHVILTDESTEEEEDLDRGSQRSAIPDSLPMSQTKPKPAPKRLGVIGGSRSAAKAPEKSKGPEQPKKSSKAVVQDDDETASEDESAAPPPRRKSPSPPAPKPKKGMLGKIGGKKKEITPPPPAPEPEPEPEPEEKSPSPVPTSAKKPKRLGAIGGKSGAGLRTERKETPKQDEQEVLVERGRGALKTEMEIEKQTEKEKEKEETPPPRENSLERADRKRMELKRELEAKAKAPAKKKRRF